MFRPKTDSDHPGGEGAEAGKGFKKFQSQRRRDELRGIENALKQMLVQKDLNCLRQPGGPFAAQLNPVKVVFIDPARAQFFRQQVGGRDRVLNCEIDAHAANGGHRVRRVSDAKQAVPMPLGKVIDPDREEFEIVPGL